MGGAAFKHNWPGSVFLRDIVISGGPPKPLEIADFHYSETVLGVIFLKMLYQDRR